MFDQGSNFSYWHYRIVRKDYIEPGSDKIYYTYGMHEVYFDDDDKPVACTSTASIMADSPQELKAALETMLKDCGKEVLNYKEIVKDD